MDYKIALVVLVIVSCPWFFPEYGKIFVYSCLFTSTYLYCVNYLKANVASKALNMLREIQLKATFERWMSNVKCVTRKALKGFLWIFLVCVTPVTIQVYVALLVIICFICFMPFQFVWTYIKNKYLVNTHPWVMSVVNWIKRICNMIFKNIFIQIILFLVGLLFVNSTYDGLLTLLIVQQTNMNYYFSNSMGVRKCETNVRLWEKMDNLTGSQTHLVKFGQELKMVYHPDIESLLEGDNQTLINCIVKGVFLYMNRKVYLAKNDFKTENNNIQIVAILISWIPQLKYFAKILPCLPYLICCYTFRHLRTYLCILVMIVYILMYVWFLCIRYSEHGLFGAIFHWNTCCHVLVPYGMWIYYTSWVDKPEPESQELEHATSQPHATQTRSARGRSPARRAS